MAKRTYWRVSALFLGILSLTSGLAADVVVNAVASGNWSNPNTWSPAVLPNNGGGTTYAVDISKQGGIVPPFPFLNVVVDVSPTVDSVTLTGNPGPTGINLVGLTVSSNSTLTAGTIEATGFSPGISVSSGGNLNANGVAISNGEGGLSINGTANIGGVSLGPLPGPTGIFSVGSGGVANVGGIAGGQVFVGSGGTLNLASGGLSSATEVAGTLTVGTGNLFPLSSQNTVVNNGSISLRSALAGLSTVDFTCGGCFSVGSNGTYDEVIDSATAFGTLFAPLVELNGTLDITLANAYIPPVGQSFVIMSATGVGSGMFFEPGISGTFANIEGQTFNNGTEMWDVQYTQSTPTTPGEVVLTAVPASAVPEPSLVALTGFGLAGIVAWSRNRRRSAQ